MRPIEGTNRSLESIEFLLKSIDYQLTKLVSIMESHSDKDENYSESKVEPKLLTTKEASQMFGLSEYELRRGFKEGIYPAIKIGGGKSFRRLRWRSDLLEEALGKRILHDKPE